MKGVSEIAREGKIFAIVVRRAASRPGTFFFTPSDFSLQLGLQIQPKGRIVERHRHKSVRKKGLEAQEVLTLFSGRIRVDLFDGGGAKLRSVVLNEGDAILLARGGHKVTFLEDARVLIIKQGPHSGDGDKEFH